MSCAGPETRIIGAPFIAVGGRKDKGPQFHGVINIHIQQRLMANGRCNATHGLVPTERKAIAEDCETTVSGQGLPATSDASAPTLNSIAKLFVAAAPELSDHFRRFSLVRDFHATDAPSVGAISRPSSTDKGVQKAGMLLPARHKDRARRRS